MAEPRIADDYAFIASRLRELERSGVKWAVWYEPGQIWSHLEPGKTTRRAGSEFAVTLFDTKEDAVKAIAATSDSKSTKCGLMPRIYDPETGRE